ncbi:MAG: hypothetical protein IIA49_01860 [Bacteroidetes bacterium]|nr:hypothetical protein [Bacteroidota bacterium]MCH7769755.1 hypothetical protein [Bacteroidota bacterium]
MKTVLFIIGTLLLFTSAVAQMHDGPRHHMREKLEQLEKIKLIETLNMDEETTLRFFSRRNKLRMKVNEIKEKGEYNFKQLDSMLKAGKSYTDEELRSLIDETKSIPLQIEKTRLEFISSLNDILTLEQIASFILFERKFKEKLRNVLVRDRTLKNYRKKQ